MRGHSVLVVAADPQSPGHFPFDKIECSSDVVDGVQVTRLRLAAPDASRTFGETYRHPLLEEALDGEIAEFRPDLIYQVSGYVFGVVPLELARKWSIRSVLFVTDFWHVCPRITLLRPDGQCCPGPRRPADCAACRICDRGVSLTLGLTANRLLWRLAATGPWTEKLGSTGFTERANAVQDVLSTVGLVIANSSFLGQHMIRLGVPQDRLLIARQGIDAQEFHHEKASPEYGGPLRLLYLGQISNHKGVDLLTAAVRTIRSEGYNVQLRMYGPVTGNTAYAASLVQKSDGDSIVLQPSLSRHEVASALGQADALVVPSRWYENSPNVILEAFAAGVPVVTANFGGMAEMVRHGVDGQIFEPDNASDLANVLRNLIGDTSLLPRLRAGIRRLVTVEEEMLIEEVALWPVLQPA